MSDPVRSLLENASAAVVVPEGDLHNAISGGRKRRMVVWSVASVAVVGLIVGAMALVGPGTRGSDELPPVERPSEREVGIREQARDGDISFQVGVAQCDRSDATCFFELQVENLGDDQAGPFDTGWQVLTLDNGTTLIPDASEIRAYRRFFTSRTPFNLPVDPGDTLPAVLIYSGIPGGALPTTLELHSGEDSEGVLIELERCDFVDSCESPSADLGPQLGPSRGTEHDQVWIGSVGFQLGRMDCGGQDVGDQDSQLKADGKFCAVSLSVENLSDSPVTLPVSGHFLIADGENYGVWPEGMEELAADDPGSPFTSPLPPKGGATAALYFDIPRSAEPEEVALHMFGSGAEIRLTDCGWNHYQGHVTGGCYPDRVEPEIGKAYPHTINTYAGATQMLQVTCFDFREWEVVSVPPTPVPEGFLGQGTMTLVTEDEARYDDNSGLSLDLRPTDRNERDPGICGP